MVGECTPGLAQVHHLVDAAHGIPEPDLPAWDIVVLDHWEPVGPHARTEEGASSVEVRSRERADEMLVASGVEDRGWEGHESTRTSRRW